MAKKRRLKKTALFAIGAIAVLLIASLSAIYIKKHSGILFSKENKEIITIEWGQQADPISASYKKAFSNQQEQLIVTADKEIDWSILGSQEICYSASYKKQTSKITITYQIVDSIAPTINLDGNLQPEVNFGDEYKEEGYSANDNYDGDISDKVQVEQKDNQIIYTITDSSGNKTTATREIVYKDLSAPVISLTGDEKVYIQLGSSFNDPGYKAMDNMDGDVTSKVVISSNVNTSKVGSYKITYTVTDKAGNTATKTRSVGVWTPQKDNPTATEKIIYLTFDDGPGPYTERLLSILKKYNVKVTFFVTNTKPNYQNMIKAEYNDGHTVAIHSYTHNFSKIYKSQTAFWDDIEKMNDLIYQQTGTRSSLMRFAGGTSNTASKSYCKGIMTALSKDAANKGYRYCDWNVSSGDAGGTKLSSKVYENVVNGCSKRNISWVLMHDVNSYTVDAVEDILIWGISNGYTFLPITNSSSVTHHKPNN